MQTDRGVRHATADDAPALAALRRRAAASGIAPEALAAGAGPVRSYLLHEGAGPIGFCDVERDPQLDWAPPGAARIRAFFIAPERGHTGLGAYLALSVLRLEPDVPAWVGIAAADNRAIRGFWEFREQVLAREGWRLQSRPAENVEIRFIALRKDAPSP